MTRGIELYSYIAKQLLHLTSDPQNEPHVDTKVRMYVRASHLTEMIPGEMRDAHNISANSK